MRNCLIVLVMLIGCAVIAGWLTLHPEWVYRTDDPSLPYMIASWQDYDDPGLRGVEVNVGSDEIDVDISAIGVAKRITEKGHWSLHAFYVDSHLDSPPQVEVARELKNEDLEVDIGRFLPSHPGKIVCVKIMRLRDSRPHYPVDDPKVKVAYPPPKGLIRVGMLKCDLDTLPWHADRVDVQSDGAVHSDYSGTLSDGSANRSYFPSGQGAPPTALGDLDENAEIYTYHSDRSDAPKLLVTVYHGRVTEVTGGAEETADIPYQLPAGSPPPEETGRRWRRGSRGFGRTARWIGSFPDAPARRITQWSERRSARSRRIYG